MSSSENGTLRASRSLREDLSNIEPLLRRLWTGWDELATPHLRRQHFVRARFIRRANPALKPSRRPPSQARSITWDGRLDNRAELIALLREELSIEPTDAAIVGAAL